MTTPTIGSGRPPRHRACTRTRRGPDGAAAQQRGEGVARGRERLHGARARGAGLRARGLRGGSVPVGVGVGVGRGGGRVGSYDSRRDGSTPALRSFWSRVSSALSRRRAVSAPTLSSSPTFCTTMWMSRRSCWPRCVAVNGAPGPSAATASLEISIAAACALGACPPLRSMASLMRWVRREFSARSAGRSMRARERRRDRRGCFRARLRRLENGHRGLSAGARARVAPGERLVRKVGRGVSRRRGGSAARRGQAGADGTGSSSPLRPRRPSTSL